MSLRPLTPSVALAASLLLATSAARAEGEAAAPAAAPALTLEQAVQLALDKNHDQINSQLLSLVSEQAAVTAKSAILPNLNFNASIGGTRIGGGDYVPPVDLGGGRSLPAGVTPSQSYYTHQFSITARQLIFDGGKWWNNLDVAAANLRQTKANIDEQKLTTRFTVEQKFFELLRARRQLEVLGEAARRSREQADYVQKLFEGGRSTQADVYAARANRENDEVNRLGQEARVELARFDLAATIGLDPTAPLTAADPPGLLEEPAPPPAAKETVEKALGGRPSLKAFALVVESEQKQIAAAKGDYWPVVAANASYGRASQVASDLFDSPEKKSTLQGSISLTWNVFNGFATDANVRTQELQMLQAQNDLRQGKLGVAQDVEKAIASLSAARSQARVAQLALETAQEGLKLARTRQQVGLGTQLEVRDAELKLTQAELNRVNALLDGREQESALRRAVGG